LNIGECLWATRQKKQHFFVAQIEQFSGDDNNSVGWLSSFGLEGIVKIFYLSIFGRIKMEL
jgi:hypothetical protein